MLLEVVELLLDEETSGFEDEEVVDTVVMAVFL